MIMCKFHKDVARAIATNPENDQFDAGQFCVGLLAMAAFRIEQYMPEMHGCDGFVPAQMATDTAVRSFADSGLARSRESIDAYSAEKLPLLQAAIAKTAAAFDLDMAALGVPDTITSGGYKHCAKMDADPTKAGPFMDEAVVQLFGGYDDAEKTWARGRLDLLPAAHKPEFEKIRAATAHFMAQDGVRDIMHAMFENALARIFMGAHEDLAAGRGLSKTEGCVMCGHGDRAKKPAVSNDNAATADTGKKPSALRDFARAARDGLGGAIVSHIGCIATPIIAGAFGLAVSGPFMAGMMLVTAPAIAMGATWGLNRMRGHKTTPRNLAISATIAVGMAAVISQMTGGHDNHAGHNMPANGNGHHHHIMNTAAANNVVPLFMDDVCTSAPVIKATPRP